MLCAPLPSIKLLPRYAWLWVCAEDGEILKGRPQLCSLHDITSCFVNYSAYLLVWHQKTLTVALIHSRPPWIFIRHAKTQSSSCYKERSYTEWLESGLWYQIAGINLGPLPLSSAAVLDKLKNHPVPQFTHL